MENSRHNKWATINNALMTLALCFILAIVAFNAGNILIIQKAADVIASQCEAVTK